MPFAAAPDDQTRIFYDIIEPDGVPDASLLPTVVFTHGFGSGSDLWSKQTQALKASGRFRGVVWDMRGHAKSDSPEDPSQYSKMKSALDLLAVLEACGVSPQKPAILCGHSMGGYDNMLFYFLFPEYVCGFVLYATGPGFAKDAARAGWNKQAEKLAKGYDEKGLDALLGSDKEKGHRSAKGLANAARGMFAQRDEDELFRKLADGPLHCAKHLGEIGVPVRIVVGERDKAFNAGCEVLKAKLPNAALTKIADAGHMMCEKNPEAFNSTLLQYLDDLMAPSSKL